MLTLSSFATRLQMQEVLPDSSRLIFLAGIPVFHNDGFEIGELAPGGTNPPALQQAGNSEVCLEPRSFDTKKRGERRHWHNP